MDSRITDADEPELLRPDALASTKRVSSEWTNVSSPRISTELAERVPFEGQEVGTRVPLKLRKPIRLSDGRTLTEGTVLTARIVGLSNLEGSLGRVLAVRLESFVGDGYRVAFHARCLGVEGHQPKDKLRRELGTFSRTRIDRSIEMSSSAEELIFVGNSTDALLLIEAHHDRLSPPLRIEWESMGPGR